MDAHRTPAVAAAVRVHRLVPHHLPVLHDRAGGVAHRARGAPSRDRAPGLSSGVRVLAQDLRRRLRARRRLRHRDGVPVRHQLERALAHVGADPGAAALLRDLHRLLPRGELLRRPAVRPRSASPPWFYLFSTAMVALGTTFSAFWIMVNNSWMQVPVGYVLRERRLRPDRLGQDHLQPGRLGALSAHAARLLPDRRVLRRRDRRLVPAAAANSTPRRASCCAWAFTSRPCWCRRRSSSATSPAITSTTISRRSSRRSRAAGTTSSPPAKS